MPPELSADSRLEIGHVLFIDIVGYSQLLNEEQKERLDRLTEIVLATATVRESVDEELVRLPTGDGMALTFRHSAEEPPRCALEIAEALQKHPELRVRMGIHSGPVSKVTDVSGRTNLAGAGINMAQRVMDCGDAGHILLSQHVADDLVHSRQWAPRLQDLGECEVKHGVRLHLVNLYAKPLGNPEVPGKIRGARIAPAVAPTKASTVGRRGLAIAVTVLGALLIAALLYYRSVSNRPPPISTESTPQSLAVLPLRNLSGDQAQDYFAEGVTDSLTTGLAQIHSLRVLSFQSVQKYRGERRKNLPEIARELNVDAVVEGSVQKSGDTVMINAQLIQAPGDRHLWAERYTRNARDMLAAESEIVLAITDAIKVQLTPGEKMRLAASRPIDPEAQSHYFLGRFHYGQGTEEGLRQAISEYEQAIQKEPNFASAYAGIADCYNTLSSSYLPPRQAMPAAEKAARKAVQIDPNLAEAHAAIGYTDLFYHWNRAEAEQELSKAIELNPNYPTAYVNYALLLVTQSRFGEALERLRKAQDLEPTSAMISLQIEWALFLDGKYDQVLVQGRHTLALEPQMASSYSQMGLAYLYLGDNKNGLAALKRAADMEFISGNVTNYVYGLARTGQKDEAERVLDQFLQRSKGKYICAYEIASAYEGMNERSKALEWLQRGFDEKCDCLVWGTTEPWMGQFRRDPRFKAILAKAGLL